MLTVGNSNRTVARRRRNRVIVISPRLIFLWGWTSINLILLLLHHSDLFLPHNFSWFYNSVPRTTFLFCTFHFYVRGHTLCPPAILLPTQTCTEELLSSIYKPSGRVFERHYNKSGLPKTDRTNHLGGETARVPR